MVSAGSPPGRYTPPPVTLHLTFFEGDAPGINALSEFRIQQLLPRLQAIHERITGIQARYVHLVATEAPMPAPSRIG